MLSLLPLIVLTSTVHDLPLVEWARLASAHDAEGLRRYLAHPNGPNPFVSIRTPGAYIQSLRDWAVLPLTLPGETKARFVTFTSTVIVEDLGDLVFAIGDDGKLSFIDERETQGATIDRHRFDVKFDLKAGVAHITDRLQISRAGTGPIMMRIGDKYHVTRITDAKGRAVPFSQAGGTIVVGGESRSGFELNMEYEGNPENQFMARPISEREATLAASIWYPMIGRRPTPYDLSVHIPKDWIAVGQGDEIGDTGEGNGHVVTYRMNLPAVWLSLSAGPFKRAVTKIQGREYATVSAEMTEEAMELQNRLSAEPIEFFSRNFAPYPFRRWTNLDSWVFGPNGGALEAYSYATYPTGAFPGVDGHETGHTWWGGILNNDYMRSFWNESFAEYSNWLFLRERVRSNREDARRAFAFPTASEFTFEGTSLAEGGDIAGSVASSLGYMKGPMVLGVLEDEIGGVAMMRAMREWLAGNPARHIGSWEEFEHVVDRVTGKNYGWFFDQWVRSAGMPNFSLSGVQWKQGRLSGLMSFVGKPYRFHTDALLRSPNGETAFKRVEILPDRTGRATFSVPCPGRPESVTLNPWQVIPRVGSAKDAPASLSRFLPSAKVLRLPGATADLPGLRPAENVDRLPDDLAGKLILGSVASLRPLLKQAGLSAAGDKIFFQGVPVDVEHGGVFSLIDLPNDKHCAIGIGKSLLRVVGGKSRVIVFDETGRLLRARTEPVTRGELTSEVTISGP